MQGKDPHLLKVNFHKAMNGAELKKYLQDRGVSVRGSLKPWLIVRITDIDGHIEYITFAKEYGSKKEQTHPTWHRVVCNYERFL